MGKGKGLRILSTLFLVNLAIITWSELKSSNPSPIGWPRPSRYLGLGVAFSLLGIFSEIASSELAAVIGAGLTVGLIIQNVNSSASSNNAAAPQNTTGLPTAGIQV